MVQYFIYLSGDTNTLRTQIQPMFSLPQDKRWKVGVVSATAYNSSPNVSVAKGNNTLRFSMGATNHVITFQDGLYSVNLLANAIVVAVQNLGLASNLIVLGGDSATGHTIIQLNDATVAINWTTSTIAPLLGFNPGTSGPSTSGTTYYSDNIAAFNQVNELLFHCSSALGYLRSNVVGSSSIGYSDVVAAIPFTSPPGFQTVYTPYHITAASWNQGIISELNISWTDELGQKIQIVDTWTVNLCIFSDDDPP